MLITVIMKMEDRCHLVTPAIQAHGMVSEKSEANYHDILDEWKQMTASGCDSKDKTLKVAFGGKIRVASSSYLSSVTSG